MNITKKYFDRMFLDLKIQILTSGVGSEQCSVEHGEGAGNEESNLSGDGTSLVVVGGDSVELGALAGHVKESLFDRGGVGSVVGHAEGGSR